MSHVPFIFIFNVNVKVTDKNKLAPLDMDHKYPATVFFVGDCIYVILMACSSTMVSHSLEVTTEQGGPKVAHCLASNISNLVKLVDWRLRIVL